MTLDRCMYCGSSDVSKKTKKSLADRLGIVFSDADVLKGVNDKEKVYYHCEVCGADATSVMNLRLKESLERYLREEEEYEPILEMLKKKYQNIEWEKPIKDTPISINKCVAKNEMVISNNENMLADKIWQYYLKCKIPYMSIYSIASNTQSSTDSVRKAMRVLESRGLVVLDDDDFYIFYDDVENIRKNIKNYQLKPKEKIKEDTIKDPRRLSAIKEFLSSNSRESLNAYSPCEDGYVYITDSFMAFKLKCNYLPFNVVFNGNFSQKYSYIKKYENKYLNIIEGTYPNIGTLINFDKAMYVIKLNLEELKEKDKLKENTIIYDISGDHNVKLDISRLIQLTKILGIKDETFKGYASSPVNPVYIFNENGEMGLILPHYH